MDVADACLSGTPADHLSDARAREATLPSQPERRVLDVGMLAPDARATIERLGDLVPERDGPRPPAPAHHNRDLKVPIDVFDTELRDSPMVRMKPPTIPETPPEVLRDEQLKKLLDATAGQGFDERRDRAIVLLLVDTGIRLGEIAELARRLVARRVEGQLTMAVTLAEPGPPLTPSAVLLAVRRGLARLRVGLVPARPGSPDRMR
jgi:hypothetical protein